MKPDHPPLYLQACHHRNFSGCDDKTLRGSLKDHGIDGKRLSRFSLMSLLAAMPLAGQIGADCSIILAAPFSSPRRFLPTFLQHAQDGTPARSVSLPASTTLRPSNWHKPWAAASA